jgi:hypothetical protein
MAKALIVRFKRQIRGYDPDEVSPCPEHRSLARALKHLDTLASAQGWQPLTEFVSEDPDMALDLVEDEDEAEQVVKKPGPLKWFSATAALATVRASIEAIEQLPRRLPLTGKNTAKVVTELKDIEQILSHAQEKKVPFRFFTDFG